MVGETELPALAEAADSGHRLVSGIQPVSCRGWCAAGTRGRPRLRQLPVHRGRNLFDRPQSSAQAIYSDLYGGLTAAAAGRGSTSAAAQNPAGTHDPVPNAP